MSAQPVDVLAVLDDFAADYRAYIPQFHAQNRKDMKRQLSELADARAAVAELIEAGQQLARVDADMTDVPHEDAATWASADARFRAALARCGGGQ